MRNVFSIYESLPDPSLSRMNTVVSGAINLCSSVYILVGFFGYVAFHDVSFGGNILVHLVPSPVTRWINIGFVMSIALGFPLVVYPCRVSVNSLLFRRPGSSLELPQNHIPELRFKCITFCILASAMCIGIVIPSIEVVLGLLGSTMGTAIAILFPSVMFIKNNSRNNLEKMAAQLGPVALGGGLSNVTDKRGNILVHLVPSPVTRWINIGFVMSIALGFPLVVYPCRVSVNSLLFRRPGSSLELPQNHIPELRFKCITFCILASAMCIGIVIPSIEVVLGLLGSTMGTAIAILFPSVMFIKNNSRNNLEKMAAQTSYRTNLPGDKQREEEKAADAPQEEARKEPAIPEPPMEDQKPAVDVAEKPDKDTDTKRDGDDEKPASKKRKASDEKAR
ncbi:putative sodium-coupled neutral amino acid transporter 10 [Amphibalanus amphitrite]|uniref:Putative sodium-coupled neutral amino acid transporter 10 n=1 Tax=Amphibalanus amphitrite TaxID=1232801 RepID=A0A6A4V726_AMPAM|nr:putative sodium-coupled neutral amino acid transporter 10 [Amphibalanus amphitrite]